MARFEKVRGRSGDRTGAGQVTGQDGCGASIPAADGLSAPTSAMPSERTPGARPPSSQHECYGETHEDTYTVQYAPASQSACGAEPVGSAPAKPACVWSLLATICRSPCKAGGWAAARNEPGGAAGRKNGSTRTWATGSGSLHRKKRSSERKGACGDVRKARELATVYLACPSLTPTPP